MAAYFNANQIKAGSPLTITLDNDLVVVLEKLPTGSLTATNEWTGESFCCGASHARKYLEEWESAESSNSLDEKSIETHGSRGQNVGYIRVSTVDQNTARQLQGVELDRVFEEKLSAKTVDRPELQACLEYLRVGDTLHIHSLDRVCRSGAGDAVTLVEQLTERSVSIVFHKEGMRFDGELTAAQRGVLGILASVAQMERELIRERQREGIAAAKAEGKHLGRPKATTATREDVERLKGEGLSMVSIAKRLGVGRATVYRLLDN